LDCFARYARFARIALGSPPTSSSLVDEKRVPSLLLSTAARDPVLDCFARYARCVWWLAALAAMFAEEPPSSSDPTKRLCRRISTVLGAFRRLLLQIGGANIAGADRAWESAYFVLARGRKACPLASPQHGARSGVRSLHCVRSAWL